MAPAHPFRFVLTALVLAMAGAPLQALQLGESKAQTLARHGAPGAEDRGRNTAIYFWEGWSAELEYRKDAVHQLIYRRHTYLENAELTTLLQSNGGLPRWRETTDAGESMRRWERDDGAIATCLAVRPLMMTFQGGQALAARPTVVVTVPTPSVSTSPPIFPKLLGSVSEPLPSAPLVQRSLPKLYAEEIGAQPLPSTPISAQVVEPPSAPSASAPPEGVEGGPAAAPMLRATEETTAESGSPLGWIALIAAAISGGFFLLKTRGGKAACAQTSSATPAPAPRAAPKSTLSAKPAFALLRRDQCELLVGEIFRREGYTAEVSAAVAQDDDIDLTLRRDGETILVQCKHWNATKVGEREVREFHGAMMTNGAPRGIFATTGTFTRDAAEFAEGKQIDLMDRTALEECTAAVARPGENLCAISEWVADFAAHARIFDPECPICRGSMAVRHNRASGAAFWSCRNHPRCPGRREPRLDLLTVAAGH